MQTETVFVEQDIMHVHISSMRMKTEFATIVQKKRIPGLAIGEEAGITGEDIIKGSFKLSDWWNR